ncbi:hypothetical protein CTKZ_08570 [Cellulomonas algicola]|uniref:Uncharacterized protein n=1 Tax=Cellulomonas algicola TaxID=2071633 RepID=A0A401UX91_9CELL|nr:hypothetical protein [Cellulomonas algicola]GCD19295.1 hypothetical protein CTKZ_08570 [Cellulomonas algicola]
MGDVIKGVLGGGWGLVVGWILPALLTVEVAAFVLLPAASPEAALRFGTLAWSTQQLLLAAAAAVIGLVLAANQAPLYRLLEGYLLWPRWLFDSRVEAHRRRWRRLNDKFEGAPAADRGVRTGLAYERAARYPAAPAQFAPTQLGNAIRRFEMYANDRYRLDSQLLWHRLLSVAPERSVTAMTNARANVDFFVAALYGSAALALAAAATTLRAGLTIPLLLTVACSAALVVVWYRSAVLATDEWASTVTALIDLSRADVAKAYGLTIPSNVESEREMWRVVNTFVRRPYEYSESKAVPHKVTRLRSLASRPIVAPTRTRRH